MREFQPLGMQQITAIAGQAGMTLQPAARLIKRIADQRMAGVGQMNARLMGPAARDLDIEQRAVAPALEHYREAVRWFAVFTRRLDGAEQRMRHRANRSVDHEHLRTRLTMPERAIRFLDGAIAPRACQLGCGGAGPREQHESRGMS